ncbi:MAG: GGDEF domain-containing protein [Desulfovibrionaceae bacterium]
MLDWMDMRTLLLVGALACLTLAGVMVYYAMARRTYPGFHYWTGGIVCSGVGTVLVVLRGVLPDFVSIFLANALIAALPLLLAEGLAAFVGLARRPMAYNLVLYALFLLAFAWGTYLHPNLPFRIVVLCLTLTILFAEMLVIAVRRIPDVLKEQDRLLVTSILFALAASLFRVGVTVLSPRTPTFLAHAGTLQFAAVLLTILAVIGIAGSFLILNTHRMERDLNEARRKIETLANTDGLTGLFNRRYFDAKLKQELERLQRSAQPLSLIMADIDCFKLYNDTYGHQAGDDCLKQVAVAFQESGGRVSDIAARYGGEELVMLLPNTDGNGVHKVALAIQAAVQALAIPHATSTAAAVVTLSVGIATVRPDRSLAPDMLVRFADQALYQSKAHGKNQIRIYG